MDIKLFDKIASSKLYLFIFFVGAAIFLRFFSFIPSVLDHDESTYLIIGRDIAQGKALYSEVTDTKPAGIFLLYALFHQLFGYSIFWIRFSVAAIVGVTAFLIHQLSLILFKSNKAAIASGVIYLFYTSMWSYHGLSPNAELYFNLCTVGAFILFQKNNKSRFFLGGLIMGIGFMIKYLILFDFVAIMLFLLITDIKNRELTVKEFIKFIWAGLGILLPFAFTHLFFWLNGNFDDFKFITYELPAIYKSAASIPRYFKMLGDVIGRFLPISFFFFYVFFSKQSVLSKSIKLFFSIWLIAILVSMYLPGKEFSHYTIQLMLPISLIAGLFFSCNMKLDAVSKRIFTGKISYVLLALLILAIQIIGYSSSVVKTDQYKQVANYIKPQLKCNDFVFVSNYEQIIYFLLQMDSPTKYVHSNILFDKKLSKAFKIDPQAEVEQILNRQPLFVLVQRKNELVEPMILNTYVLDTTFRNGEVKIYRKK